MPPATGSRPRNPGGRIGPNTNTNTNTNTHPHPNPRATPPQSARGMRVCRRVTRHYAKTFHFASHCLPREVRAHAYAVYGFCRWADNTVDDAADLQDAAKRLDLARQALDDAYSPANHPLPPGLASFRRTVRARGIPRQPFEDLLEGMAMDLVPNARYPDVPALELYCYRVAGVVGLVMAHVFGFRNPRCLPRAVALGNAMQLTNILRDVREDWERGRLYLPLDELARFGVSESQIHQRRVDDNLRALLQHQIRRARNWYRESDAGVPDVLEPAGRLAIRLMGRLYAGILDDIEARDYDVFSARAHVPAHRKLATLARCLLGAPPPFEPTRPRPKPRNPSPPPPVTPAP